LLLHQPVQDGDRLTDLYQDVDVVCRPGLPTLGQTFRNYVTLRHEPFSRIRQRASLILCQWDLLQGQGMMTAILMMASGKNDVEQLRPKYSPTGTAHKGTVGAARMPTPHGLIERNPGFSPDRRENGI